METDRQTDSKAERQIDKQTADENTVFKTLQKWFKQQEENVHCTQYFGCAWSLFNTKPKELATSIDLYIYTQGNLHYGTVYMANPKREMKYRYMYMYTSKHMHKGVTIIEVGISWSINLHVLTLLTILPILPLLLTALTPRFYICPLSRLLPKRA